MNMPETTNLHHAWYHYWMLQGALSLCHGMDGLWTAVLLSACHLLIVSENFLKSLRQTSSISCSGICLELIAYMLTFALAQNWIGENSIPVWACFSSITLEVSHLLQQDLSSEACTRSFMYWVSAFEACVDPRSSSSRRSCWSKGLGNKLTKVLHANSLQSCRIKNVRIVCFPQSK